MLYFLDSGNFEEIREATKSGLLSGVTTNPTLIGREQENEEDIIRKIDTLHLPHISVEVLSNTYEGMIEEAKRKSGWANNTIIKIPITLTGLQVINYLERKCMIKTNATLVFSINQAVLATKAGASFISPFIGRLNDYGNVGVQLLEGICDSVGDSTNIIVGSIRKIKHIELAALLGADIVTLPYSIFKQLV